MASSNYAGIVNITVDNREGFWLLTSEDLPGFLLCGEDLNALGRDTPNVIKGLFRLNYGMEVEVVAATGAKALAEARRTPSTVPSSKWVATPVAA